MPVQSNRDSRPVRHLSGRADVALGYRLCETSQDALWPNRGCSQTRPEPRGVAGAARAAVAQESAADVARAATQAEEAVAPRDGEEGLAPRDGPAEAGEAALGRRGRAGAGGGRLGRPGRAVRAAAAAANVSAVAAAASTYLLRRLHSRRRRHEALRAPGPVRRRAAHVRPRRGARRRAARPRLDLAPPRDDPLRGRRDLHRGHEVEQRHLRRHGAGRGR